MLCFLSCLVFIHWDFARRQILLYLLEDAEVGKGTTDVKLDQLHGGLFVVRILIVTTRPTTPQPVLGPVIIHSMKILYSFDNV